MTALQTFVSKRQQEVRPATGITAEIVRKVNDEKIVLAKSCLARFDAATIKPAQLPGSPSSSSRPDSRRKAAPR